MIFRIVQKELLGHLLTLRFVLGGICCLVLILVSAYVLTRGFESRLEAHRTAVTDYESRLQKVKVYSQLGQRTRPEAHRPPNILSILSSGLEVRLGDYVVLAHGYVPFTAESSGSDNPYLAIFPAIDFVTVFQVVLSLLALLFAYDAVSGEQEDGTLKLLLSGSISRADVLLGKYLGAMLALILPLLISLSFGLLIVAGSEYVTLGIAEWTRIALILLASLLYLSLFYLIGLLCSCIVNRSASALALCLFAWVAAVLIFPGAGTFAVDRLSPVQSDRAIADAADELTSQIREKTNAFLKQHNKKSAWQGLSTSTGSSSSTNATGSGQSIRTTVRSTPADPELTFQRDYYRLQETYRIEIADRIWQLRKDFLERNHHRQARLARNLSYLSPAALYESTANTLAGTGLDAHLRFLDQTRTYRRELIQYYQDRDVFGSRTWFTDDRGPADIASLPRFRWQPESAIQSLRRAWFELTLLIAWNSLLFWVAYIRFAKRRVA